MDEVSLLIDILTNTNASLGTTWSQAAAALVTAGTIASGHAVTPDIIDIRTMAANKGVRVDLSRSPATIVVFEDSQSIEYPTIHYDGSNFNQLFVGSRSESNDRAKRLFGYKVTMEAKRFALTLP